MVKKQSFWYNKSKFRKTLKVCSKIEFYVKKSKLMLKNQNLVKYQNFVQKSKFIFKNENISRSLLFRRERVQNNFFLIKLF